MCPVVYAGSTVASKTHAETSQAVSNFNGSTGGFQVQTSIAGMVLADK